MNDVRFHFVLLMIIIVLLSLITILLSIWAAKKITGNPKSFSNVVRYYFRFGRNNTEQRLTRWRSTESIAKNVSINTTNGTIESNLVNSWYNEYPIFHKFTLPIVITCAIFLAFLAYNIRIICAKHNLDSSTMRYLPSFLYRNPRYDKRRIGTGKQTKPDIDYIIVHGTKEKPFMFALANQLEPAHEEGDVIDTGTQYDLTDISEGESKKQNA